MSVTMLPSGGTVIPTWRPTQGGASKEDGMTPSQITASEYARTHSLTQSNWLEYLQGLADKGDVAAKEKLIDIFASEQSAKTARDWTAQREDSVYQRLNEDLKKAGLSPYLLSSASPVASSSSGKSYTGSQMVSKANNETNAGRSLITALLAGLGIVLSATIRAGTAGLF